MNRFSSSPYTMYQHCFNLFLLISLFFTVLSHLHFKRSVKVLSKKASVYFLLKLLRRGFHRPVTVLIISFHFAIISHFFLSNLTVDFWDSQAIYFLCLFLSFSFSSRSLFSFCDFVESNLRFLFPFIWSYSQLFYSSTFYSALFPDRFFKGSSRNGQVDELWIPMLTIHAMNKRNERKTLVYERGKEIWKFLTENVMWGADHTPTKLLQLQRGNQGIKASYCALFKHLSGFRCNMISYSGFF
jgi:hypothetical protein